MRLPANKSRHMQRQLIAAAAAAVVTSLSGRQRRQAGD